MKQHYEDWGRKEFVVMAFSVLFLSCVFGYALGAYFGTTTLTFTVKSSRLHINYLHYTQVVTTEGTAFYLYDYPVLEAGETYVLNVRRHMEGSGTVGGVVYDVLSGGIVVIES
jgi:hypothetical protein